MAFFIKQEDIWKKYCSAVVPSFHPQKSHITLTSAQRQKDCIYIIFTSNNLLLEGRTYHFVAFPNLCEIVDTFPF